MDDKELIAEVFIAPRAARVAVSQPHKALGLDVLVLEEVRNAFERSAATARQLILADVVQVVGRINLRVIHLRIKREHMDLIRIELFHNALDLAEEVSKHGVRD